MSRPLPDVANHMGALSVRVQNNLRIVIAYAMEYKPSTVWIFDSDFDRIQRELLLSGFDARRGFKLAGLKVGRYKK
jgi:hypothetical protein